MVHDRHVPLEGGGNMRDLGGLPIAGGGLTRRGRAYRAGALSELSVADQARLTGLGIATVVDLRSEAERAYAPSRLPPGVAVLTPGDGGVGPQPGLSQRDPESEADAVAMMLAGNRSYPERLAGAVAETFRAVAAETDGGVLFHCSAGKDRTGYVAALLLLWVGVERETVIEDYLATNLIWKRTSHYADRMPEAVRQSVFSARADYIAAALDETERRHGSLEGYLARRCCLSEGELARARAAMTA